MKKRTTSRRQTQLDRIERKLDELLSRTVLVPPTPPPGTWIVPQDDTKQRALERIYRIAEGAFDAPSCGLEASMSRALDTIIGAAFLAMGCNADSTDVDAAFIRGGEEGGGHA